VAAAQVQRALPHQQFQLELSAEQDPILIHLGQVQQAQAWAVFTQVAAVV
jgi:hypothetical protein